jgi:hypothetical protein
MIFKLKEMIFNEGNLYDNINIFSQQVIEQVTNFIYLTTEILDYCWDSDFNINVFKFQWLVIF